MILNGFKKIIFENRYVALETPLRPPPFMAKTILSFHFDYLKPSLTSPLSLFPILFPKIVKSQVSISLKILAKFQFQNLDQILCSMSEPNFSLKKVTKNSALISWPNFSFSTKLSIIRSSSVATLTTVATSTIFQLAFLHTRVTSVKFGTDGQTRQCNGRTWIW